MPIASRAELESRLKGVAAHLIARQFARAAFTALAGAAIGLGLGVLFLDALPRALFSATAGAAPIVICAAGGFMLGLAFEIRRFRAPTVQDAALALESRLKRDTGALGAALRVSEGDAFYRPLMRHAAEEFEQADAAPSPVLIPTARLIAVPLIALASLVAFVWVLGAGVPANGQATGGGQQDAASAWAPVDIGGGRADSDREAYRKALGLQEQAATLNRTAATLRDTAASAGRKQDALDAARSALTDETAAGMSAEELPAELPAGQAEQEELAAKFESAAAGMNSAAKELKREGTPATEDSGSQGEFGNGDSAERVLVPFVPPRATESTPQAALAVQTPARRAVAQRAVQALESITRE